MDHKEIFIVQAIMQTAIHAFLLDSQQALVIWAALATLAVAAFVLLSATARREWSGVARAGSAWAKLRQRDLAAQTAELRRYADELTVAAQRAGVTAERRHEEWVTAQHTEETAWQAFEVSDIAIRRAIRAEAIAVPRRPLTPSEVAARERHLHRVATDAYHRGDLSIEQLMDALTGRSGWDPCRHPADQEIILCRFAWHRRLVAYQAASTAERLAWHDADVAAAARRSLDDEVFAATAMAHHAERRLAAITPPGRRHPHVGLPRIRIRIATRVATRATARS